MTNKLSKWYGYPCELWHDLADSPVVSYILNANGIPSIVVLQTMHDIGSTTNRKFRNRKVDTLVATLTKLSSKLVSALQDVADTLNLNHMCSDNLPEVHVWTKDNSPEYLPYLVGDSSYWSSCLRTGVLSAVVRGVVTYDSINWVSDIEYDTLLESDYQSGSNIEYLSDEYDAFHDGELVYLTVGKFFNEDVDGPRARMRIHLVTKGNKQVAVMDRVYSSNYDEDIALYVKARELYGDMLYSVEYNRGALVDPCNAVDIPLTDGVYTDYDQGFKVVDTLTRQVGSVNVVTTKHVHGIVRYINLSKNNITTPLHDRNYIEAESIDIAVHTVFAQGSCRLYVDSCVAITIRKLLNYVGLLVSYNFHNNNHTVKFHDNVQLDGVCIRWVARGCEYSLDTSLYLMRRNSATTWKLYDVKHDKWLQYRGGYIASNYRLTRHTIHLIYKFLPYAKYQSNRVRPMSIL